MQHKLNPERGKSSGCFVVFWFFDSGVGYTKKF